MHFSCLVPVKNWSHGGALLSGLEQTIGENEEKEVTLKFKLSDQVMEITHKAKVLRKAHDRFAMKFAPLTSDLEKTMNAIVADAVTQEFANSQQ